MPKPKKVKKPTKRTSLKEPIEILEDSYKEIIKIKDSEITFLRTLVKTMIGEDKNDAENSTPSVL